MLPLQEIIILLSNIVKNNYSENGFASHQESLMNMINVKLGFIFPYKRIPKIN